MTTRELMTRVKELPGVETDERAESVITAVFTTLRDRLTPNEADDVWAQLPTTWKRMWDSASWWHDIGTNVHRLNKLDREEFITRVRAHIRHDIPAADAVRVVFHALKEQISAGESSDVAAQLPEDLRTMWKAA